mgnify:CR=1 FL=1
MKQPRQASIISTRHPPILEKKSERIFGLSFREFKKRNLPFYRATKTLKSKEADIRRELDAQLKRLQLDSIDFYPVWNVVTLEEWNERKKNGVIEAFVKLKEGLIHLICVSHHLIGEQIKELIKEQVFEAVLFGYSGYNFRTRQAGLTAIRQNHLGAIVMNPLGGGIIPQNPDKFAFLKQRKDQSLVEAALHFIFCSQRNHDGSRRIQHNRSRSSSR